MKATASSQEFEDIAPPPAAFPAIGAREIFAPLEPIEYVIEGLDMCPGAPTMWAGYGYSAKTVTAQAAGIAIAGDLGKVWGCFKAARGRVLHIDYEQGSRLTRERYQRLAMPHLLGPDDLQGYLSLVTMPPLYLDDGSAEAELTRVVDGYNLVIVDSLRAAAPSIDENSSDVRRTLDMLSRVSERTGAVFLVIHHARKPNQNAVGGAKMAIRGSGALFDACSSVLIFEASTKGKPVRVSHEKARTSGQLTPDFELEVSDVPDGGNMRAGLVVTASAAADSADDAERAARAKRKARTDQLTFELIELFRTEPKQPGANVIATKLGHRKADVLSVLSVLIAEQKVREIGSTRDRRYEWAGDCP